VSGGAEAFLAGAPQPQRALLRALLALVRRPGGMRLLARVPPLQQLAAALREMGRYDDDAVAGALGWDPVAVVTRGRELRRAEGRP
jgi:hypothetical protein